MENWKVEIEVNQASSLLILIFVRCLLLYLEGYWVLMSRSLLWHINNTTKYNVLIRNPPCPAPCLSWWCPGWPSQTRAATGAGWTTVRPPPWSRRTEWASWSRPPRPSSTTITTCRSPILWDLSTSAPTSASSVSHGEVGRRPMCHLHFTTVWIFTPH